MSLRGTATLTFDIAADELVMTCDPPLEPSEQFALLMFAATRVCQWHGRDPVVAFEHAAAIRRAIPVRPIRTDG